MKCVLVNVFTLPPSLLKPTFAPFFIVVLITVSSAAGTPTKPTLCPNAVVVNLLRLATTLLLRPTSSERCAVLFRRSVAYMLLSVVSAPRRLLRVTATGMVLHRVSSVVIPGR